MGWWVLDSFSVEIFWLQFIKNIILSLGKRWRQKRARCERENIFTAFTNSATWLIFALAPGSSLSHSLTKKQNFLRYNLQLLLHKIIVKLNFGLFIVIRTLSRLNSAAMHVHNGARLVLGGDETRSGYVQYVQAI